VFRGEVWWATLGEPRGSEPGFRRPLLIVQSDSFNRSRIQTVLALVITSNTQLSEAPGNVMLPAKTAGLPRASVVNVSQLVTIDKRFLAKRAGKLRGEQLRAVDEGLRLVLAL
jgi:mRNA interferase MazF